MTIQRRGFATRVFFAVNGWSPSAEASSSGTKRGFRARRWPVSEGQVTEHSLSVAGADSAIMSVEHCDWFADLFAETMILVDGELAVPDRPGTGYTFRPEHLAGATDARPR